MKKILTLTVLLATLYIGKVYANHHQAALTIDLATSQPSLLIIDGINYGTFCNQFSLNQIQPGYHLVKIISRANVRGTRNNRIIFCDNIFVKPFNKTVAKIERGGQVCLAYYPIHHTQYQSYGDDDDDNYDDENYYHTANYPLNEYTPTPHICAVNEQVFCQFKQAVANAWFDSDRKAMIENFLVNNYVSSQQVYQLIRLIDFESTRLEVAKCAYNKTIDQQNYYSLFNAFDFESSKKSLSDYMVRG